MAELICLEEAFDDIDRLCTPEVADLFYVLLEELENDSDLLETLFRPTNHYQYSPPFEVKDYVAMQRKGRNFLILKVRNEQGTLLDYRLLLGYHSQIDTYYALTLMDRDIDYELNHPDIRIAIERYEQCGIPTYPY